MVWDLGAVEEIITNKSRKIGVKSEKSMIRKQCTTDTHFSGLSLCCSAVCLGRYPCRLWSPCPAQNRPCKRLYDSLTNFATIVNYLDMIDDAVYSIGFVVAVVVAVDCCLISNDINYLHSSM